jgi:hypothetical protein
MTAPKPRFWGSPTGCPAPECRPHEERSRRRRLFNLPQSGLVQQPFAPPIKPKGSRYGDRGDYSREVRVTSTGLPRVVISEGRRGAEGAGRVLAAIPAVLVGEPVAHVGHTSPRFPGRARIAARAAQARFRAQTGHACPIAAFGTNSGAGPRPPSGSTWPTSKASDPPGRVDHEHNELPTSATRTPPKASRPAAPRREWAPAVGLRHRGGAARKLAVGRKCGRRVAFWGRAPCSASSLSRALCNGPSMFAETLFPSCRWIPKAWRPYLQI